MWYDKGVDVVLAVDDTVSSKLDSFNLKEGRTYYLLGFSCQTSRFERRCEMMTMGIIGQQIDPEAIVLQRVAYSQPGADPT